MLKSTASTELVEQQNEFTKHNESGIIFPSYNMEDELMPTKFYNYHCIYLYAYLNPNIAYSLTDNAELNKQIDTLISLPITLYENEYTARLFRIRENTVLMAFAIQVDNNIYDELDLSLESEIKSDGRTAKQIKTSVAVIRQLKQYKEENKKAKTYIEYVINNKDAIKSVTPLNIPRYR
jgi:hypothetical protein